MNTTKNQVNKKTIFSNYTNESKTKPVTSCQEPNEQMSDEFNISKSLSNNHKYEQLSNRLNTLKIDISKINFENKS